MSVLEEEGLLQVVVGPGTAQKVRELIDATNAVKDADSMKAEAKQKCGTRLEASLKVLSNIFIPLIPGFIACGLLLGISNILRSPLLRARPANRAPNLVKLISLMGGAVFFYMNAMIGANTAKEAGGSPVMGMIMAVFFVAKVEGYIRKYMPNSLDLFFTFLFTLLVATPVVLIVIQPIGLPRASVRGRRFCSKVGAFLRASS